MKCVTEVEEREAGAGSEAGEQVSFPHVLLPNRWRLRWKGEGEKKSDIEDPDIAHGRPIGKSGPNGTYHVPASQAPGEAVRGVCVEWGECRLGLGRGESSLPVDKREKREKREGEGEGEGERGQADGKGSHLIEIDHKTMGQTCGILPVGVDSAVVKTEGLKWDLGELLNFRSRVQALECGEGM